MPVFNDNEVETFNCSALVLPNNTICLEHPEEMLKPWRTHPLFFEIITIHVIIFVFGVFGNVIVVFVMAGDRKSRSATNFFLVSLALGDLLMLCIYGPLETYTHFVIKWDETGAVCKTAKFAEFLSATSSVLNLLAVTIERFIVIVFPIKSQAICTVSNIIRAVLSVWIFSLVLAFPVVLTTSTYHITFTNNLTSLTLNYCTSSRDSPDFVVYQFFIIFLVPSITMTVCYSFVIRELWVSTKKMNVLTNGVRGRTGKESEHPMSDINVEWYENSQKSCRDSKRSTGSIKNGHKTILRNSDSTGKSSRKFEMVVTINKDEANNARKQVIKMLILVIVLFYICWGPRVSMDVLQKLNFIPYNQSVYRMRIIFNVMTFFHGCINPFIYSFMSKNFQARVLRYMELCGCKRPSKWSRRFTHTPSGSVRSQPRSHSYRGHSDGPHGRAKLYGSFLSCDTKTTELESALNLPSQSSFCQTSQC